MTFNGVQIDIGVLLQYSLGNFSTARDLLGFLGIISYLEIR